MKDFEELLGLFESRGVRALVVGGYAVAFHGRPRFTKDIDLWVEPTAENAQRILDCLEEFGFGSVGLAVEDFSCPGQVVQLGYPPNRIDLMTSLAGVAFEEAWGGREQGPFGSKVVFYLGRSELLRNKRASGRPQDLVDVEDLEAAGPGPGRT